jgi:hypothetical protein
MEHLTLWALCRGNLEGGSFTGDPEGHIKEGFGNRHLSSQGPSWATWSGLIYQGL